MVLVPLLGLVLACVLLPGPPPVRATCPVRVLRGAARAASWVAVVSIATLALPALAQDAEAAPSVFGTGSGAVVWTGTAFSAAMTTASSVVVAMMGRARADVIDRVSAQEARARDLAQQIEARVREIEARLGGDLAEVRTLVSDTRERSVPRAEHQSEIGALRGELHEMRRDVHRVAATQGEILQLLRSTVGVGVPR